MTSTTNAESCTHGVRVLLHQLVLGPTTSEEVSHLNGNKMDNRSENLKPTTQSENALNLADKPRSTNRSGVRGVAVVGRRYRATLKVGKRLLQQRCATIEEAKSVLEKWRRDLGVADDGRRVR